WAEESAERRVPRACQPRARFPASGADDRSLSGIGSGLHQFAGFFQMLLEFGQRVLGETGYLGVVGAAGALEQLDGALMGGHLVVGVGRVEGVTFAYLKDQRTGTVHQLGLVGDFHALVRGKAGELLVGCGVILDHPLSKGPYFGVLGLLKSFLSGFYFGQPQGRGLFNEVLGVYAVPVGINAGHATIYLIAPLQ